MKRKFQSLFLPLALLFVFHLLHSPTAFADTDGSEIAVEGKVCGSINREPVGENGFGYDPVFMYEGRSFAEIPAEEKNAVSHRGDALKKLVNELKMKKA